MCYTLADKNYGVGKNKFASKHEKISSLAAE
jgi:hypothetical protein